MADRGSAVLWWSLPRIVMNPPLVDTRPPHWTPLPSPSPAHPSRLSQNRVELPVTSLFMADSGPIHVSINDPISILKTLCQYIGLRVPFCICNILLIASEAECFSYVYSSFLSFLWVSVYRCSFSHNVFWLHFCWKRSLVKRWALCLSHTYIVYLSI